MKKTCGRCGLQWGIAKRMCTCGVSLIRKKVHHTKVAKKKSLKQCSACGLQWPPNKSTCTCGHEMIRNDGVAKRKREHAFNKCSTCKRRLIKNHTCISATRKQYHRGAKTSATNVEKNFEEVEGPATPARPIITRLQCGVCDLHKTVKNLRRQCRSSLKNVSAVKLGLADVESKAQREIDKIKSLVQEAKTFVNECTVNNTKCVFAIMRAAAAKLSVSSPLSKKAKEKKKTAEPNALNRSKLILAGQRAKRDTRNEEFLEGVAEGTITLAALSTDTYGNVVRPLAVSDRHTASRRLKTVTRGLIDAAQCDGQVLVWIIHKLYQTEGIRQAFDVSVCEESRTVCLQVRY